MEAIVETMRPFGELPFSVKLYEMDRMDKLRKKLDGESYDIFSSDDLKQILP